MSPGDGERWCSDVGYVCQTVCVAALGKLKIESSTIDHAGISNLWWYDMI